MSSQPPPRSRQRRQRYSGITQPRTVDFVESESAAEVPLEETVGQTSALPAAPGFAPEPEIAPPEDAAPADVAGAPIEEVGAGAEADQSEPGPGSVAGRGDRSELLAAARAHMRGSRRAGQMLDDLTPPGPWNVGPRTRFKLAAGLAVILAAAGGFLAGNLTAPAGASPAAATEGKPTATALTAQMNAQEIETATSAAFSALKQRRFAEARARFSALLEQNPQRREYALEVGRAYLYEGNFLEAQRTLEVLVHDPRTASEAYFVLGLVQLTERSFDLAVTSFRKSAQAAPTRGDTHYMLAEAQRRAGKTAGAAEHYEAALDRNQVETNELTYRLKIWISRIQDGTMPAERLAELEQALAKPNPTSEVLVTEAARQIKAGNVTGCAQRLEEASKLMEPLLLRVVLMDPLFSQEAWRPEMAPLYKR